MAPKKPIGLYVDRDDQKFWQGVRTNTKRSAQEIRSTFRDIDRRLADIESYYVSKQHAAEPTRSNGSAEEPRTTDAAEQGEVR